MIKILLSAVGMHDPFDTGGEEGPVLHAVQALKPGIVFLFPSRRQVNPRYTSTENQGRGTAEALKKAWPDLAVYERALDLPDPTDYRAILKTLTGELEKIKVDYSGSQVEYMVAISSGTPQIQAAFLVLINNNRIKARAYQVVDPRFIAPGERRLRLVETHFMEEANQIYRAREYFKKNNFEAAGNELTALACNTLYPEREKKAEVFCDLTACYFYWDLYQHQAALERLARCLPVIKRYNYEDLAAVLRRQAANLEEIIALGEEEAYLNLVDLYHNALRRLSGRQYVDCLSRFKRIYEGAIFYKGAKTLKIKPRKKIEHQPLGIRQGLRKRSGYLTPYDLSELYTAKTGEDVIPKDLATRLNEFANQRNYTINNHGMQSVSAKDAKAAMDLAGKLLKKIFPGQDIEDYCLSPQALDDLEAMIFDRL